MKRILSLLCIFLLCSAFQCGDEPLEGEFLTPDAVCELAVLNTAEVALNFLGADPDNFSQICNDYKVALEAQILACGDADGSIRAVINELGDCTDDDQPVDAACETAISDSEEAQANFDNSTDENYTDNCNAYKTALEAQITACGDADGNIQATINDLGDCTAPTTDGNLVGTWRITSLTSNGVEELQQELDEANICFYEETYTETNLTETEFSGADCDMETITDTAGYTLADNIISFDNGDDSVEIIELTENILRYQDVYTESGETITDIYTFERQTATTNPSGQISVTAGTLNIVFDEVNVVVNGTTLQVSGETSASNNYTIYFEIEENTSGDQLINETFVLTLTSAFMPSTESMEPFTSNISDNSDGVLSGTFSGLTQNADNGNLNLTSGMINITY